MATRASCSLALTTAATGVRVIVDYTCGDPPTGVPFARAYLTSEEELPG